MAQRKSAPSASKKTAASRPGATRPSASGRNATPAARPPVKKKPGKSIVNQRQTPWGLIVTTILIVAFAAGVVAFAVASHKSKPAANAGCTKMIGDNSTSYLNELQCAKDIQGVTFTPEPNRNHVN